MKTNIIHILPELIANRIAAGEIIERPASVVRELLDNSIDAGAKKIEIEIRGGGCALIAIRDDGSGIDPDGMLLAFERHATSKIQTVEDLDNILTLGFRGEALPSIASVASVVMESFDRESDTGARIHIVCGKVIQFEKLACAPGTRITIRDLLKNVPARRKFLKTTKTEMAHVEDCFIDHAMVYPEIHFMMTDENKTLYDAVSVDKWSVRIQQLMGNQFLETMLPVRGSWPDLMLEGFVGDPQRMAATARSQRIYCNGRRVRDRIVTQAVYRAYHEYLTSREHPVFVLKINMNPEDVDVNVHPAKSEVRFRESQSLFNRISQTIAETIGTSLHHQFTSIPKTSEIRSTIPVVSGNPLEITGLHSPIGQETSQFRPSDSISESTSQQLSFQTIIVDSFQSSLRVIGQFQNLFILVESGPKLLVIDQHTAHERILFEKFKSLYLGGIMQAQALLFPVSVELEPEEFECISEFQPLLNRMGVLMEEFGQRTYLVRALPGNLADDNPADILKNIAGELADIGHSDRYASAERALLITLACRKAIKSGDPLTMEQMQQLIAELQEYRLPASCPHGRPIIVSFEKTEIERWFKR